MLSRRSVRVKVMQLLYSLDRDSSLTPKDIYKAYVNNIDKSYGLFLFNISVIQKITACAVEDGKKRKSKHLPKDYDKAFTPKLFTNELIADITNNKLLTKKFESLEFESKINSDYIQKIYDEFAKSEEYREFILKQTNNDDVLEVLLALYRFCRQNEYFVETLEDAFYNWGDDKSLVIGAVKKYLKILPTENKKSFVEFLPEDETVKEFGLNLLKKTVKLKKEIMNQIIPVLENWDHERLALVDTILLQLAICELREFSTIPPTVTLNEYVELAKNYSTIKSKEFVNGVLDKLMKEMEEAGTLKKEGRGLEG